MCTPPPGELASIAASGRETPAGTLVHCLDPTSGTEGRRDGAAPPCEDRERPGGPLSVAQSLGGLEAGGAAGGEHAGEPRGREDDPEGRRKGHGVGGAHPEEQALE